MGADTNPEFSKHSVLRRHAATTYFLITFVISWLGAFLLAAPNRMRGKPVPEFTGLMIFPVMLLGPCISSLVLTLWFDGRAGLRDLGRRMGCWKVAPRWYAALLIPPLCVLAVLFAFKTFVSPVFAPNSFFMGTVFGAVAGFFEEIGWMGFAFPRMVSPSRSWILPAILLGVLWGCWHIPAINYLGTATPHEGYWLPYFLSFAAAMTAIRVIIAWIYVHTQSVLLSQLLHASSTASLVVFSPAHVTARQEALWYSVYAALLWILIALASLFSAIHNAGNA